VSVHAKHVRQFAPCAVPGAGCLSQNAAGDGGWSVSLTTFAFTPK
jgi:hypothetical protein